MDGSLWFSVYERMFASQTIMVARMTADGRWEAARVAPFSGSYGDRAPRFAPDGQLLYFTSNRPAPGHPSDDMNIWVVERQDRGAWGEPQLVDAPISVPDGRDMHASVLADGTVFIASSRPGGAGRSDIWRIPRVGSRYSAAERLPEPINDGLSQPDLYVQPDGRWMVLVVTDRPGGLGGDDLWFSRYDGGWGAPQHLGEAINSAEYEYGPTLSPDGRWLYFTSHRRGSADLWRVPASVLPVRGTDGEERNGSGIEEPDGP